VRFRRVAIILPLVAFAACGGDDGSGSNGGTQDPAALEGKSWILTQMLTAGGQTQILDVGVSASFDGTTISGNAGCNGYHASYEASGNEISFGPVASSSGLTVAGCVAWRRRSRVSPSARRRRYMVGTEQR